MSYSLIDALSGERILHSNSLATVTGNCIIVRELNTRSQTVISLERLSHIKTHKTSYPGLIAIAGGLFVIAAAASISKQGGGAGLPIALLALSFLIAYFGTRRASVSFGVGSETTHSVSGSLKEAAMVVAAVQSAQALASEDVSST
jgi:hypothetical protein